MKALDLLNSMIFPVKLLMPQPVLAKLPGLTTNEDIRVAQALRHAQGYMLDIGCGPNRLVNDYRGMGHEGLGVDVFDWGGQDLLVEDTAALPFDDATFDTVTMIACINHIPNRDKVLVEARRVLKPDGRLLVTNLTPMISVIWHKIAFWDKDQHERGMEEGEVWGFSDAEMRELFRDSGFTVAGKRRFSWGLNNIYVCHKSEA